VILPFFHSFSLSPSLPRRRVTLTRDEGRGGGGEATVEFSRGTQAANEPPRYTDGRRYNTLNTFASPLRIDDFIDRGRIGRRFDYNDHPRGPWARCENNSKSESKRERYVSGFFSFLPSMLYYRILRRITLCF